jgi:hypothetical protein
VERLSLAQLHALIEPRLEVARMSLGRQNARKMEPGKATQRSGTMPELCRSRAEPYLLVGTRRRL